MISASKTELLCKVLLVVDKIDWLGQAVTMKLNTHGRKKTPHYLETESSKFDYPIMQIGAVAFDIRLVEETSVLVLRQR